MRKALIMLAAALSAISCSNARKIHVSDIDGLMTALREHDGSRPLEILLEDGSYFIEDSLLLDGSLAPGICIRARHSGNAVITKAHTVPASAFSTGEDGISVLDLDTLPWMPKLQPLEDYYYSELFAPWIFCSGHQFTPARWPDNGWAHFKDAKDIGGKRSRAYVDTEGEDKAGSFYFSDERAGRWNSGKDAFVTGFLYFDWCDEYVGLRSYDPSEGVVYLKTPTQYGVGSGGWGLDSRRFRIFNCLSELDTPGEWYIDREARRLHIIIPEGCDSILIACDRAPVICMDGARGIRLEGLAIAGNLGDGIIGHGCKDVEITGCTVTDIAGYGIVLDGSRNRISRSEICHIGQGAIKIIGGDRTTLTASGNVVSDCDLHDYGFIFGTYRPGVGVQGCGTTVEYCHIHDAPHYAIQYWGNDHLFECNEIDHVLLETADAGAFYTGADWTSQGNMLRYNYIHDLQALEDAKVITKGIYLDDCDSGDTVEGNILVRVPRALMLGGGRDNIFRNNLVIDCTIGFYMDARGPERFNTPYWNLQGKLEAFDYKSAPWSERYPGLVNILDDDPLLPRNNLHSGNVYVGCGDFFRYNPNLLPYIETVNAEGNKVVEFNERPRAGQRTVQKFDGFEIVQMEGSVKDFDRKELLRIAPQLADIPFDSIGIR